MRLIDADELINQGYEIVVDGWQYDTCNKSIDIDDIPTAYDVDKVVEELEEAKHEICLSDEDLEHYQNGIDNAIEIVKQGDVSGASEDICEWKLKDACYTTSIKHYYSLPTSIVKTFNNCPYCGKKIKIKAVE